MSSCERFPVLKGRPELRQDSAQPVERTVENKKAKRRKSEVEWNQGSPYMPKNLNLSGYEISSLQESQRPWSRAPGFLDCLPTSLWNVGKQTLALESDRPGVEDQRQRSAVHPGASLSTFLSLRVLQA